MRTDYNFVIRVINNSDNNRYHYPAIKNLISLFKTKWASKNKKSSRYEVYVHSLNKNLKRSFR